MTTVTAQYVYNFSTQPDESPWVETGYVDRSGVSRIVSGAYRRSSGSPITQYTGVSHNGVGAFVVKAELKASGASSDQLRLLVTDSAGTGYAAVIDMINKQVTLRTVSAWVISGSGLGSGTTPTWISGDILTLSVIPGTPNTIQVQYNGATIGIGFTTHTFAMGAPLYGSIGIFNGNNGLASIGSWGIDGIEAGGTAELSTTLVPATGYQYVTAANLPTGQPTWLSVYDGCTPAVANGDQWECPTITSAGATITQRPDGTLIVNDGDPDTEHSFTARLYDQTTLDWGSAFTITINAPPPPGSVINRDTTATPYRPSANGVTYFGYPNGNAPVVIATSYGQLRTMASTAATFGGGISVEAPYIRGFFEHSATDPNGNGDDGGLVIAAAGGGFWVRQFNYSLTNPIELDWFESVVENHDITALFKTIASDYAPKLYLRMSTKATRLVWSNGTATVDWTVTYGILKFCLLESSIKTELYIASPDDKAAWQMNVDEFVLGSPAKKATYNDYLLTFSSTWTFDNRVWNDSAAYVTPPPAIHLTMNADYPSQGLLRCNATKLQGNLAYVKGSPQLDFRIAGKYSYAAGVELSGPGVFDFESPYISDECGRQPGWTGTSAGLIDRNIGLARSGSIGGVVSGGQAPTTRSQIKGELICQYGGGSGFFFWDYIGTGIDDPLIIRSIDRGFTGPNEFGKPAGIQLQQEAQYRNHTAKSDGFGKHSTLEQNKRFFKIINEYTGAPFTSPAVKWNDQFFLENNQADDVPGATLTYTQYVTFIVVNCRGKIWQENGPLIQGEVQPLDHIDFMGDGINVAFANTSASLLTLYMQNSLKYAKVHYVEISGDGNVIDTVNVTNKIVLMKDGDCVADKLTFSGTARNIIHFDDAYGAGTQAFTVTNINAPVGSTVTKDAIITATFTLNGQVKTLPYTIVAGDNGTAVPDIPPNPLLSAR